MDRVICNESGSRKACDTCPLSTPTHLTKESRHCTQVIYMVTKVKGFLFNFKGNLVFRTHRGKALLKTPVINKTQYKRLSKEGKVVAWVTHDGIEILRYDNGPLKKLDKKV